MYSADVVSRFRAADEGLRRGYGERRLPLLAGLLPPVAMRHAAFLHTATGPVHQPPGG